LAMARMRREVAVAAGVLEMAGEVGR